MSTDGDNRTTQGDCLGAHLVRRNAEFFARERSRLASTDAGITPPSRLHFGVHVPPCTCLLNRPEACQRHPVGDCGCAVCVVARRAQAGARAAGAAAEGEAPTNAWRPIESARPRNGERVVVWDGDMRVATWRESDAFWELDEGGICDPSLWLPTPSVWMAR